MAIFTHIMFGMNSADIFRNIVKIVTAAITEVGDLSEIIRSTHTTVENVIGTQDLQTRNHCENIMISCRQAL